MFASPRTSKIGSTISGNGNQERQHVRRWEIVDSAEDVKLELILKEIERPCGKATENHPIG